ncbi:MAG: hypothetical protein ABIP51_12225, partial [Bacteroidia bacterium]
KTDIKMNEAKKIYEDDRYLVIMPLSENASCTYGAGTKWCISATYENKWKSYTSSLVKFYFIFDKQLNDKNPLYKVAIAVYPNNKSECFNASDKLIDFNEYIIETTIPESTFEYVPYNKEELLAICIDGTYEVVDGLINVKGSVDLAYKGLIEISFKFGTVTGNFNCSNNKLTSLKGCPTSVGGNFVCFNNKLTSLEGCPVSVGNVFVCSNNKLTSLKGCPTSVGGYFNCSYNKLTSLEGCPTSVGGSFNCSSNDLISLQGCPTSVRGNFVCSNNKKDFTEEEVKKYCKVEGKIYVDR